MPFNFANFRYIVMDMNIIQAFLNGNSLELMGDKPKHIVTVVSDVFVFETKVYKIYKSDSDFFNKNFNDLSDKENRFHFTRRDFEMNNCLTPEVYTKLLGVVLEKDKLKFVEASDESDELVIEMNKVDMSNQLIKLLVDNKITLNDCFEIGKQLGERIKYLPKLKPERTVYEDFMSRYVDVGPWVHGAKDIPNDKVEKYLKFVKDFISSHKDELNSKDLMGTCIDIHSDNAVLENNIFLPIDMYAPKEAWLHGYKFLNVYRIAADIYGFLGKKGFDRVLEGYESSTHDKMPRNYDKFLITYCELINWPYQYMLAEKEPWRLDVAKKYEGVLEEVFRD